MRRESGHRRYPREEVRRLRLVARALAAGFRAGRVVAAGEKELLALLESAREGRRRARGEGGAPDALERFAAARPAVELWLAAARRMEESALTRAFHEAWEEQGPLRFLEDRAVPFLKSLGEAWEFGEISIAEEHFASERLNDFLATMWRRLNERSPGRPFVLATLPRDLHRLGLQMAAVVVAVADHRVVFLGADTPPGEIERSARRTGAAGVCLSVSNTVPLSFAEKSVAELRGRLDPAIPVALGGEGAPEPVAGVIRFSGFADFHKWLKTFS